MALRVVGAGAGRTGTLSLKAGLEQLLGQPCYHMLEVYNHPDHVPMWKAAAEGEPVDWEKLLDGYGATSDFPACLFWREILEAHPDAVVVLSTRKDSASWWASAASQTIFSIDESQMPPEMAEWLEMWKSVAKARFTLNWKDERASIAAYERHNAEVRSSAPKSRLVEWQATDGWKPLCDALGMEVPQEPFPHLNKRGEFPHLDSDTTLGEAIDKFAEGGFGSG